MTGFKIVRLMELIEEIGEDSAKAILSNFSCPLNPDVEKFLHTKALSFAAHGWAQTYLVFAPFQGNPVLVGYFALSVKTIGISRSAAKSNTTRRKIAKFATYDPHIEKYTLAANLIAQLGKNYHNGYNSLISGDELLYFACQKVALIQSLSGGRFVYLECEDVDRLHEFYSRNGFWEFDRRSLDKDETNIRGDYLVQMIKYLH